MKKMDSSVLAMDCHAANAARNDRKNNAYTSTARNDREKVDSRANAPFSVIARLPQGSRGNPYPRKRILGNARSVYFAIAKLWIATPLLAQCLAMTEKRQKQKICFLNNSQDSRIER